MMKVDLSRVMVEQLNGDIVHPVEVTASGSFLVLRVPDRTAKIERTAKRIEPQVRQVVCSVAERELTHSDGASLGYVNCVFLWSNLYWWGYLDKSGIVETSGHETTSDEVYLKGGE